MLGGERGPLIRDLKERMHRSSDEQNFELAAQYRDAVKTIESLAEENSVVDFDPEGRDYIAWTEEGVLTSFAVLSMRGGKMTGKELFHGRSAAGEGETLETFLTSYYSPDRPPPAFIYVKAPDTPTIDPEGDLTGDLFESYRIADAAPRLERWFAETFPGRDSRLIHLLAPEDRHHMAILAMARQNAGEDLRRRLKARGNGPALEELQRVLRLPGPPIRIEGFDIAQLEGKHPVASLVSFKNGIPDKKNYRHFKLRTVVGVVDDFAAVREAVDRRYRRLITEGLELPDFILIDGGIGQVNAAAGVLDKLGLDCPVAGLAKRNEEIWLPGAQEPIVLSKRSEALKVLQFVRDETHRFATSFNQRLRSGDLFFPILESVEGIGPKRAAAVMRSYASMNALAAASPEEIARKCRISALSAAALRSAAALALENQEAGRKRLAASGTANAALLAAEAAEDYRMEGE
jgi:excinuclease ABC subunit C